MQIKASEIADIIRRQIEGHETSIDMAEVGTVISVGDGIARLYGLDGLMAGELIQFPHDVHVTDEGMDSTLRRNTQTGKREVKQWL